MVPDNLIGIAIKLSSINNANIILTRRWEMKGEKAKENRLYFTFFIPIFFVLVLTKFAR